MCSQQLPDEVGFSMERAPEDILPTPPLLPKRLIPVSNDDVGADPDADILDISGSVPKKSDLLSEAISKAVSDDPDEDLQDAGWNIMDDMDPADDFIDDPVPVAGAQKKVVLTMGSDGEFHQEFEDKSMEVESSGPSIYPPPNQLAADQKPATQDSAFSVVSMKRRFEEAILSLSGSTAVVPPPGTIAARVTSAIGRANFYCSEVEVVKNGEPGFRQHDFPCLDVSEVADPTPKELGEERFFAVKELASTQKLRTIPLNDMVEFVLLARDSDQNLYVPSIPFFEQVVARIEINIITKFPNLRPLYWSSSRWMGCGVLELAASPLLEEWRSTLAKMDLNGDGKLWVDTFPKDSLLMGPDVSALLKSVYWDYGLRWVSHSLMYRNKAMRGNVRLSYSKPYGEHDLTRFGVSMHQWQMVYLSGDCIFMEFLSKHPSSHRFTVRPSTVVLKGGIRRPAFLDKPKSQFTWTRTTYTPALLEPVYSLKSSELNPPVFKGLAAAAANLTLAGKGVDQGTSSSSLSSAPTTASSSSTLPSTSRLPSAPIRTISSSSSSSSVVLVSSSAPASSSKKKTVANTKPKSRSARIKAAKTKAKKPCC